MVQGPPADRHACLNDRWNLPPLQVVENIMMKMVGVDLPNEASRLMEDDITHILLAGVGGRVYKPILPKEFHVCQCEMARMLMDLHHACLNGRRRILVLATMGNRRRVLHRSEHAHTTDTYHLHHQFDINLQALQETVNAILLNQAVRLMEYIKMCILDGRGIRVWRPMRMAVQANQCGRLRAVINQVGSKTSGSNPE